MSNMPSAVLLTSGLQAFLVQVVKEFSVVVTVLVVVLFSFRRGIEWSIRDFARLRDPSLTLRDRDPTLIESEPETQKSS